MKKKKKDFDEDEFDFLRPDKTRLDDEWVNQPKLFFDYACQLADARMELDEIKAELAVVKAESDDTKARIDLEIRQEPTDFDIAEGVKLTENLIKQVLIQQPDCQEEQKEIRKVEHLIIKAKHDVDVLQAAVSALDHRKAALERLVSLHGQSYFATPQAKDEDSKEVVDSYEKNDVRRKGKRKGRRG